MSSLCSGLHKVVNFSDKHTLVFWKSGRLQVVFTQGGSTISGKIGRTTLKTTVEKLEIPDFTYESFLPYLLQSLQTVLSAAHHVV